MMTAFVFFFLDLCMNENDCFSFLFICFLSVLWSVLFWTSVDVHWCICAEWPDGSGAWLHAKNHKNQSINPTSFYIVDDHSRHRFLVDIGTFQSIFSVSKDDKKGPLWQSGPPGCSQWQQDQVLWLLNPPPLLAGPLLRPFFISQGQTPLVGVNFLGHHSLLVDSVNKCLLDVGTYRTTTYPQIPTCKPFVWWTLMDTAPSSTNFQRCSALNFAGTLACPPNIYHYIKTREPPVHLKFWHLPPGKLQYTKKAFPRNGTQGPVPEGVQSLGLTPTYGEETWWFLVTLRRLLAPKPCHVSGPLPISQHAWPHEVTAWCWGLHKMDLLKVYFQVLVHSGDVPKTAIITPFFTYIFSYSTLRLCTFLFMMDDTLWDLTFSIYVDNILVFSKDPTKCQISFCTILKFLCDNGRFVKCISGALKVDFLSHELLPSWFYPRPQRWMLSGSSHPIHSEGVPGVCWYDKLLSLISLQPYCTACLLENLRSSDGELKHCQTKQALADATTLVYPVPGVHLTLTSDTSNVATGAVPEQTLNGTPYLVAESYLVAERV